VLLLLLASSLAVAAGGEGPWKVAMTLYHETLCPLLRVVNETDDRRTGVAGELGAHPRTLIEYVFWCCNNSAVFSVDYCQI
jgi:hypothetical protein